MFKFEDFSTFQRAVTIAGLGPAMLVGCTVHGDPSLATYLPAAYGVSLAFPWGDAKAKASAWKPTAPAPRALDQAIRGITNNFEGLVGVAVTSIDDGWIVASNGERPMPQQSVSKLWVAMTVLDQVDQGRIRLEDPITITRADFTLFHQPVAALVKGDAGYTASVGEIIRRAMQMSDNTCNDKLLRLVGGPDAVRTFLARKGITGVRFGPGEKLLQAGTAGLAWKPEYSMGNSFAIARSRLSPAVRLAAFESYVKDPPDGAAAAGISVALARLKRGELLSPTATAWLLQTMDGAKTGRARVHGAVPPGWTYGHKTGTGQDLGARTAGFNDVGILTAPDGKSYALAIMIGDTHRPVRERQMLMQQVAQAIVTYRNQFARRGRNARSPDARRLPPGHAPRRRPNPSGTAGRARNPPPPRKLEQSGLCSAHGLGYPGAAMPHLYLVDGSGYIFRAYHRLPPLTNKHGEPVGAVYGYTTMLWKLVDELNKADGPTHMAVVLDKSEHTFRNELYDQYKAHRPPAPEDLVPQFPMIRDATRAFSLPCIEEAGWEADDLIASYTKAALAQGWSVTIVSSDKDLMQLMTDPSVDMLDTMNNRRLGPKDTEEKFGVLPEKLGEVLALMGDSVDNVPGVKGVGPKTAAKLIQEFGTLEDVLEAAPSMKPSKMRDNLIEHAEMARLSHKLVQLASDVPLPEPLEAFELKGIPDAPLRAFLEHHGFRTLLNRLSAVADAPVETHETPGLEEDPPCDHDGYETVVDEAALDRWIAQAQHQGWVAVDTETTGVDATRAELVGVSLALAPNKACYIPIAHGGTDMFAEKPVQIDRAAAIAKLKPLLEDPAVLKIGHNLKYDLIVLGRCGIEVAPYDDTIVMSFDLDAGLHGHGMDELAATHLSHSCIAYKDVVGTGKNQLGFGQVDLKAATRYAAEDADMTLRLWRRFKPRLAYEGSTRVYEMVDRPLVGVIAGMERAGIKVDAQVLHRLSTDFSHQIAALEEEIHGLAGFKFTIGSPKQLGDVLFDKMGIKGGRKGKSGVYSTDVNELERIAADKDSPGREMVLKVLDWRQLTKLKSTYTDALQAQINPATGRVHTSYSLTGAQTGRLSSTDPNLQNIPIRTETGRQIRDAFVAEPGNVILSADYSQIELRLAAHIADVPALREAFEQGEDIHNRTAMELFGEVNRDTRGRAKTINFAILYGISRWGLAGRLDVTPDEAQAMINRYFERFPGINRYIADTLNLAKERGYTTTLFGRKTHFPRLKSANPNERAGSERAAINAPIQGTSADIIKRAMARMGPALLEAGLPNVKMLLQVHDELVFELPEGDVEAARPVIQRVMATAAEPAVKLSVPLGVEIGVGPSWGAAH